MLANLSNVVDETWWYMEVPRTGSSTVERTLRYVFGSTVHAVYAKHWPLAPPDGFSQGAQSLISVRNPYSRAVSCWQYFTNPGSIEFADWLKERLANSFFDVHIEARPQWFWHSQADKWDHVIRQERLSDDFWDFVTKLSPEGQEPEVFNLHRYNDINGHWVNRVGAKTNRTYPWQSYYTQESRELVEQLYALDFECLQQYYAEPFAAALTAEGVPETA